MKIDYMPPQKRYGLWFLVLYITEKRPEMKEANLLSSRNPKDESSSVLCCRTSYTHVKDQFDFTVQNLLHLCEPILTFEEYITNNSSNGFPKIRYFWKLHFPNVADPEIYIAYDFGVNWLVWFFIIFCLFCYEWIRKKCSMRNDVCDSEKKLWNYFL